MRLLLLAFTLAFTQTAPPDEILTFHYIHAGMAVPEYTITLHKNGTGNYNAVYAPPVDKYASSAAVAPPAAPESRDIVITQQTTAHLFEHLHNTARLVGGCESHQKNVANTGAKTISYTGPDGHGECTYNYTENKEVLAITETFQGIAVTLDEGHTIEQKRRYDRLGLDQELERLQDAVKDGRAIELGVIASTLQSLLDDPQVMDRVRKRASALLLTSSRR